MPIISVITPSYNCEEYIGKTIESVQSQTLDDWEMIIVDDCSSDRSFEVAQSYAHDDARIQVYKLDVNSGSSKARNVAMDKATGDYITFIDGDDTVMEDKFERQIQFMTDNDYAITYTNYRRMSFDESKIGVIQKSAAKITYKHLLRHTAMGTLTPIYNRHKIGEYRFDEMLRARMDYAFWLDVLKEGHVAHRYSEDMARYRRGYESLSSSKRRGQKLVWKILRHREKVPFPRIIYYYFSYVFHALKKRRQF
jgi:teichuronic acid biosynthesis glycosyltransferase TuaG